VRVCEKQLDCFGGIYKLSLSEFHKQMFALAAESIDLVPRAERNLLGHTFSISQGAFDKVSEVLSEALEKIQKIEADDQGKDRLYHVGLAAFPLSKKEDVE
jgi:uncharacterized protein (TIGR02147 family)